MSVVAISKSRAETELMEIVARNTRLAKYHEGKAKTLDAKAKDLYNQAGEALRSGFFSRYDEMKKSAEEVEKESTSELKLSEHHSIIVSETTMELRTRWK